MREPFKQIKTIDETRGISSASPVDSLNIAAFVISPTGPVERTTITSQNDLLNQFCSGSSFSANDNVTIQHVGALVADAPVDVIRVDSSTLREGRTSTGLRYLTDKDFNPIDTYETVTINPAIESQLPIPTLTAQSDGISREFYAGPVQESNPTGQVRDKNNQEIPVYDSNTFIENVNRFVAAQMTTDQVPNEGPVKGHGDSNAIVSVDGFSFSGLSNFKSSALTATVVDSNAVLADSTDNIASNDYVEVGGYTFYFEGDASSTNNLSNPIAVTTNLNDTSLMDPAAFIIGVADALSKHKDIQQPIGLSGTVQLAVKFDMNAGYTVAGIAMSDTVKDYIVTNPIIDDATQSTIGYTLTVLPSKDNFDYGWIRFDINDENLQVTRVSFYFGDEGRVQASMIPQGSFGTTDYKVLPIENKTVQRFVIGIHELWLNGIDTGSWSIFPEDGVVYTASAIKLIYNSENQPGIAVKSSNSNFRVAEYSNLYQRITYYSGTAALTNQKYIDIYFNIDKYTFYNGSAGNIPELRDIRINVSTDPQTINEFLSSVVSAASAYFSLSQITNGLLIATDSLEGYDIDAIDGLIAKDNTGADLIIKSSQESIVDKFAVIARFPSDSNNFKFSYTKNTDDSYNMTLNYKGNESDVVISFDPSAVDGYGTSLYYEKVNVGNSASLYFYIVDLSGVEDLDSYSSEAYGSYLIAPTPQPSDIVAALNKYKEVTDKKYTYLWDAGYANPVVAKNAASIAEEIAAAYVMSYPFEYKKMFQFIDFRESSGIDAYRAYSLIPSFRQAALGTFLSPLSGSLAFLRDKVANFNGISTEFQPVFGPTKGKVITPNLTCRLTKDEREKLLDYQINTIIPSNNGYQINMNLTMQTVNSYLSEEQNVQMINTLVHVCDEYADNLISETNDIALWNKVISELSERIRSRLIANRVPTLTNFQVVMNGELNTQEVIEARKAIFQVWVQVPNSIAYVLGYTRVMRLGSF